MTEMRRRRLNMWLSVQDLADLSGLSPASIWSYERGDRWPRLDHAMIVAANLGCHVEDLFNTRGAR
jgi:transcriptional regulator with XRE-family HTH domain